jgi:hypothetical protein
VGMARAPGCTLAAPSFTKAGQTPSAAPKSTGWGRAPCVMVPRACMRVYARGREYEGERDSQPAFSPLGTTGANSIAFSCSSTDRCACVCA